MKQYYLSYRPPSECGISQFFKTNCTQSIYLPENCYDTKTQQVLDDFYPKALQWCSTGDQPDNLVSLDISKCYPSILINNTEPIPLYTIHDIIEPFTQKHQLNYYGEFYIDEFRIKQFGADIKIEAGCPGDKTRFHNTRVPEHKFNNRELHTQHISSTTQQDRIWSLIFG